MNNIDFDLSNEHPSNYSELDTNSLTDPDYKPSTFEEEYEDEEYEEIT